MRFICEDGDMYCSYRMLLLSDHFAGMIAGMMKRNEEIVFDFSERTLTKRGYPTKVIKYFLDELHLQVNIFQSFWGSKTLTELGTIL